MSLLLDALNKTSGQSKPADQQDPEPDRELPAEMADDSSPVRSTTPTPELTLEAQETSFADDASSEEIDIDVDIDDAEFSALLEDTDDLNRAVQHAATEATYEGDAASAIDSINELSEEIAELPSIQALAGAAQNQLDASALEANESTKSLLDAKEESGNAEQEYSASKTVDIEQASEVSVDDSNGHLIIEVHAEPETLAEEVLQDAPLIQAYSQAQKKRRQIMLLIAAVILLVAAAVIYKLVLGETSVQVNANSFDPVTQPLQGSVESSVALEEVDPDSIPARLSLPTFSSETDIAENMILIGPAKAASKDLRLAYTALNQGQLAQAERLYKSLSNTEEHKVAALSGLASVAIANNDVSSAQAHLQHLLSVDRHNTWAAVTLAALPHKNDSNANPALGSSLSQLKDLRALDPNNHQIAYLLGNTFAEKGLWKEAQAAYFDAFSLDSRNANYAFNLAIALDHLGKAKQATDFYQQALVLAETRGADFDLASLRKRLQRGDR